jgi:hypothetical protein
VLADVAEQPALLEHRLRVVHDLEPASAAMFVRISAGRRSSQASSVSA